MHVTGRSAAAESDGSNADRSTHAVLPPPPPRKPTRGRKDTGTRRSMADERSRNKINRDQINEQAISTSPKHSGGPNSTCRDKPPATPAPPLHAPPLRSGLSMNGSDPFCGQWNIHVCGIKSISSTCSPAEKSDSDFWRFLARKNQKIREKSEKKSEFCSSFVLCLGLLRCPPNIYLDAFEPILNREVDFQFNLI